MFNSFKAAAMIPFVIFDGYMYATKQLGLAGTLIDLIPNIAQAAVAIWGAKTLRRSKTPKNKE